MDKVKGLDIADTYMNEKAATNFIKYIGISEHEQTISLLEKSQFFSFLMDGATDISGNEQESIYIRFSNKGVITEISSYWNTKFNLFPGLVYNFEQH